MKNDIVMLQGDCLEVMKDLPDASVSMILCDLPYGTSACRWDSVIPFAPLWEQYKRVLKPGMVAALFGAEPFASQLRLSNLPWYKYDWLWDKQRASNFLSAKYVPLNRIENICIFSEGGANTGAKNPMPYNAQGLRVINRTMKNSASAGGMIGDAHKAAIERGGEYVQTMTGYPTNILSFKRDAGGVHPTQKPVALLEYLIKTYTNEGDVVFDSCMGSGSTAVACVNTGRQFIGIELDAKYFEIAKSRVCLL